MKIIQLVAENIKKLVAVEITPDGNIVEIKGANGHGKTSTLDAIWWCLAGSANIQGEPIRKGSTEARIRLDLGEIIVTRTFKKTKDGEYTTALSVTNADGAKFPSPQKMLDELLGSLTFDPLAFSRMDAKSQFNTLRKFVPNVDFELIDRQNKADYDKRTDVNRRAKESRAAANSITIPQNAPATHIDESALVKQMEEAATINADIQVRRTKRQQAAKDVEQKEKESGELMARANTLKAEADELRKKLANAKPLADPVDVSELRQKIEAARKSNEERNKALEAGRRMEEATTAAEGFEKQAVEITEAMEKREASKREAIAAASLPVPGLSFGDGSVLMNGVPFEQASDAEQLRASVAIAMALNPKLRVIRVHGGDFLDAKSMSLLAEVAEQFDCQVWIERGRPDGASKMGVVLEDGHVKGAEVKELVGSK